MPITVHNLDKGKPAGRCEYIGRPRTLSNPHVIGRDGTRAEVILKYRSDIWRHVKSRHGAVWEKLQALSAESKVGEVKLLCHCKPAPCHGDVIKSCIEWMCTQGL